MNKRPLTSWVIAIVLLFVKVSPACITALQMELLGESTFPPYRQNQVTGPTAPFTECIL